MSTFKGHSGIVKAVRLGPKAMTWLYIYIYTHMYVRIDGNYIIGSERISTEISRYIKVSLIWTAVLCQATLAKPKSFEWFF